jgi:ankyrin repeat protein
MGDSKRIKLEINTKKVNYMNFEDLARMIKANDASSLRAALDADGGFNVNTPDDAGDTLLMFAAVFGSIECMKVLLEKNPDLEFQNKEGDSAIMVAMTSKFNSEHKHDAIKLLLENGANPNSANTVTVNGTTLLMEMVIANDVDAIEILLPYQPDLDVQRSSDNFSALLLASDYGYEDIIQTLLAAGADINTCVVEGVTPLLIAAQNGFAGCVQILANAIGVDVNKCTADGTTPLMMASKLGHADCVQILANAVGVDVNKCTADGTEFTALMMATQNGFADCVQILIDGGANIDDAESDGFTSLIIAAQNGFEDCVQVLIDAGADVDAANSDGVTAAIISSHLGQADCLQTLINEGADVNKPATNGLTPIFAAAQNGHADCVELLIRAGVDYDFTGVDDSLVLIAIEGNHLECFKLFMKHEVNFTESLELLVNQAPDSPYTKILQEFAEVINDESLSPEYKSLVSAIAFSKEWTNIEQFVECLEKSQTEASNFLESEEVEQSTKDFVVQNCCYIDSALESDFTKWELDEIGLTVSAVNFLFRNAERVVGSTGLYLATTEQQSGFFNSFSLCTAKKYSLGEYLEFQQLRKVQLLAEKDDQSSFAKFPDSVLRKISSYLGLSEDDEESSYEDCSSSDDASEDGLLGASDSMEE